MEVFIARALRKIRSEASRKRKALRQACDDVLQHIREQANRDEGADTDADKYFEPFKLACESKQARLMETALDCIQKLLAYGYLTGRGALPASSLAEQAEQAETTGPEQKTLMDEIVRVVCECNDHRDENVQLQVIRALLTAVTSNTCEVHETSLLMAVRACYHIHLVSKNTVNKTTAKATLTQMLSIVFQRMEAYDVRASAPAAAARAARAATVDGPPGEGEGEGESATEGDGEGEPATEGEGEVEGKTDGEPQDAPQDQDQQDRCPPTMYPSVFAALGFRLAPPGAAVFPSVWHKDAFLLLRALCKLSMKGLPDDPSVPADPIALQSKILSLELLLSVLERAGPSFRSGDKFVYAIRQYLCVSLLKNCTSTVTHVVGLSLRIFVALISHFKDHLKSEIEVFISNIFLRILESPFSTFDHKMLVLEVFYNLCGDAQALVEIFLNYDCDWDSIDLFKRIVGALAKVAKGRAVAEQHGGGGRRTATEEATLRMLGLEALVAIVKSLVSFVDAADAKPEAAAAALALARAEAEAEDAAVAEAIAQAEAEALGGGGQAVVAALEAAAAAGAEAEAETGAAGGGGGQAAAAAAAGEEEGEGMSIVESFDRKQKLKEEFANGVVKFNVSPRAGISYLVAHGHLEYTSAAVAQFLHENADALDKTQIGEFLGKEREYLDGFCVRVLHDYVDSMDFSGMEFDVAIRHFLAGFRLPGEAQKIDRMMEKFAERYCMTNKGVFPSADTAFILAFSVIMLNTDLHNPAIAPERKMTREGFIRNNRGISSGADLPDEFLSGIFTRVQTNQITLKEDDEMRERQQGQKEGLFSSGGADKRKREAFTREREAMVRMSEALFKRRQSVGKRSSKVPFYSIHDMNREHVRPMFEVAWAPMLAVFSVNLDSATEPRVVELCLEGFRHAIRVAAVFNMATERDALVNSLAKFTMLDTIREMQQKNIECVKTMIQLALTQGNHLRGSWSHVLQCLSQLARLQLFAQNLPTDDRYWEAAPAPPAAGASPTQSSRRNTKSLGNFFSGPSRAETARIVEESNAETLALEIDQLAIDRVFASSVKLSSEAIQEFVTQLCAVSLSELSIDVTQQMRAGTEERQEMQAPRVFSLQKLVEVADLNMDLRSRLLWSRIWEVLSRHFTAVGCHQNASIAMYAIDSLRQLSFKFLQKDELRDFHFQRLFLRPYEVIMTNSPSNDIRELILRCLDNMILARVNNIRSGWKSMFAVFTVAARDHNVSLAQIAFDVVDRVCSDNFHLLVEDFADVVACFLAFANNEHTSISMRAVGHLAQCVRQLAEGDMLVRVSLGQVRALDAPELEALRRDVVFSEREEHTRHWWPVLTGLAALIGDARYVLREEALETLFGSLRRYGHTFAPDFWAALFREILFPIFAGVQGKMTAEDLLSSAVPEVREVGGGAGVDGAGSQTWLQSTGADALGRLVHLFAHFYDTLADALLPEVFGLLHRCICQPVEVLARIGVTCLQQLLLLSGHRFSADVWTQVCVQLHTLFEANSPLQLLAAKHAFGIVDEDDSDSEASGDDRRGPAPPLVEPRPSPLLSPRRSGPGAMALLSGAEAAEAEAAGAEASAQQAPATPAQPGRQRSGTVADDVDEGQVVATVYGTGTVLERVAGGGMVLLLHWGGTLYCPEPDAALLDAAAAAAAAVEGSPPPLEMPPPTPSPVRAPAAAAAANHVQPAPEQVGLPFNASEVLTMCVVQLELQQVIGEVAAAHFDRLEHAHFAKMLALLRTSFGFAQSFNREAELRARMAAAGFMRYADHPQRLPNLLAQETGGVFESFRIMLRLYKAGGGHAELVRDRLALLGREFLTYYVDVEEAAIEVDGYDVFRFDHPPDASQTACALAPVVVALLAGLRGLERPLFDVHREWFFKLVPRLVRSESREVRNEISFILELEWPR